MQPYVTAYGGQKKRTDQSLATATDWSVIHLLTKAYVAFFALSKQTFPQGLGCPFLQHPPGVVPKTVCEDAA